MAIDFYWTSGGPYAWRCLLALEIKRLAYNSRLVDLAGGATRTPQFLALNPRATLPVLTDGDVVVRESQAIIYYLDRAYPDPPLYGRDPAEAATIMQEVNEQVSYLEAPLRGVIVPLLFGKGPIERDEVGQAAATVAKELGTLEKRLGAQAWLAGAALSAADVHLCPFLPTLQRALAKPEAEGLGGELEPLAERFPNIARWLAAMQALPGYDRTLPPHWNT